MSEEQGGGQWLELTLTKEVKEPCGGAGSLEAFE